MPALSAICRSDKAKVLLGNLRLIFPILKDKGQYVSDVTEKLRLQFNDDLETRVHAYGHKILPAGLMDTCASGVLVYVVSRYPAAVRWFRVGDRKYVVKGCLGAETSTYEAGGDLVETAPYGHVTASQMESVFPRFLGEFEQRRAPYDGAPPRHKNASPVVRPVVCHSISLTRFAPPDFVLDIHCGAGCNMRSLVQDIGKALGSRAHVTSMERHQHGPFTLEHALPSYKWSWEEAAAQSEALQHLWYPYMKKVQQSEKHHEGQARYQ